MINRRAAAHLASLWHGGGGSGLYVFASSGAIEPRVWAEVQKDIEYQLQRYVDTGDTGYLNNVKELTKLIGYLRNYGESGPQDGWYENVVANGRG